jgi:farnesyl-diphosphate farnesyltransferase
MVVEALRHATGALDFMDLLKNRSVWKLCAIPSALAIATLNLCFMNPRAFQENVKIRKAEAASVGFVFVFPTFIYRLYIISILFNS